MRPASFSGQYYPSSDPYLDQNCTQSTDASFYICKYTDPPFFGCCNSNPCKQDGCPSSDLAQIVLSSNQTRAAAMDPHPAIEDESSKLSKGAIVGVSIGGCAFLFVVITVMWRLYQRRKTRQREQDLSIQQATVQDHNQYKQGRHTRFNSFDKHSWSIAGMPPTEQSWPPAPQYGMIQPHIHEADSGTKAASGGQSWLKSPSFNDLNRYSTAVSELSVPQTLPSSFYSGSRRPSDNDYARSMSYNKSAQQSPRIKREPVELDSSDRRA